ncbi:MAG TPA: hypothetical protein VMG99_08865 [Thermoplasmata archaeon]|nr:hypothetical protein [Thermoplasmata archaeon]
MAAETPKVPVHGTLVWDTAGDPQLVALLAVRCSLASCHRMIRGPFVTYGDEQFHEHCWDAIARERLRPPA